MNNETDLDRLLAQAAEKIKREAYSQGWRDAITAVNKAAADLTEPGTIPEINSLDSVGTSVQSTSGGPTVGSTPWYVLQAVKKRPGMTGSEVVSVVQEAGHKVSEGSIRTSLVRLKGRKLIVSRHGKWFGS